MGRITKAYFKFKPFSIKQKKIFTWWQNNSPVKDKDGIICDGAIRSGKTVCMSLSFVMWAMELFDNMCFAMCGKTVGSFKRNVLLTLEQTLQSRGYRYKKHIADNYIEIFKGNKHNYFYIFGGKDEASASLIQGMTLAGIFLDEVALMPQSFVMQAMSRCSVEGSKYWFNCNPAGPFHWFKTDVIDKLEDRNLIHLHFLLDDNLSLTDKIKQRYYSYYSGTFYQRYILGLWVSADGQIYSMFDRTKHVVCDSKDYTTYYVSCDYGTLNPTVFLLWGFSMSQKRWLLVRTFYYSGRDKQCQLTDEQYADAYKKFIGSLKIKAVIVDPSAASFITTMRNRGYNVIKAKNDVIDGIRYTGTCINTGKIAFCEDNDDVFKEFESYIWDSKASEDKPVKEHDHTMDAIRYFCYTVLNKGTQIKTYSNRGGIY